MVPTAAQAEGMCSLSFHLHKTCFIVRCRGSTTTGHIFPVGLAKTISPNQARLRCVFGVTGPDVQHLRLPQRGKQFWRKKTRRALNFLVGGNWLCRAGLAQAHPLPVDLVKEPISAMAVLEDASPLIGDSPNPKMSAWTRRGGSAFSNKKISGAV